MHNMHHVTNPTSTLQASALAAVTVSVSESKKFPFSISECGVGTLYPLPRRISTRGNTMCPGGRLLRHGVKVDSSVLL